MKWVTVQNIADSIAEKVTVRNTRRTTQDGGDGYVRLPILRELHCFPRLISIFLTSLKEEVFTFICVRPSHNIKINEPLVHISISTKPLFPNFAAVLIMNFIIRDGKLNYVHLAALAACT